MPEWVPPEVDTERPSVARVYDYLLGGDHNFAVDRAVAQQLIAMAPITAQSARANREFLRRAVTYCVEQGIEQFLDIGSGIPTVGNVHETAQKANPDVRIAYVDIDPVAVTHSRLILEGNDRTTAVRGDIRDIDAILNHVEVRRLIDFTEPVAVLMVAVLNFLPDSDDPAGIVGRVAHAVTPGSHLVVSHLTVDDVPEEFTAAARMYSHTTATAVPRNRAEVTALFNGFDLVPPGLVRISQWRAASPEPDDDTDAPPAGGGVPDVGYAGVGRKP